MPLLLLASFFVTSPFLVAPSRTPRPAHWALVIVLIGVFLGSAVVLDRSLTRVVRPLALFVFYAFLITVAWALFFVDLEMVLFPVFYVFNLLVLVAMLVLYSRHSVIVLRYLTLGAGVGITVQFALAFVMPPSPGRETMFFNNPNQLGYFALLAATIVLLGAQVVRLPTVVQVVWLLMATYLSFRSLSASAIVGMGILVLVAVMPDPRTALALVVLLVLTSVGLNWLGGGLGPVLDGPVERVTTTEERADATWGRRGYDRIWLNPEFLPFGAAERKGAPRRVLETEGLGEIHSTWGTIVFSYGVPGSLFFLLFLHRLYRLVGARCIVFLLPSAFYGLAHQGLRQTEFWLMLGMIACVGLESARRTKPRLRPATTSRQEDSASTSEPGLEVTGGPCG